MSLLLTGKNKVAVGEELAGIIGSAGHEFTGRILKTVSTFTMIWVLEWRETMVVNVGHTRFLKKAHNCSRNEEGR